jgi:type I restriction enzyme M protein
MSELQPPHKSFQNPPGFKHDDWEHFSKLEPKGMLQTLNQVMLPALVKTTNRESNFFPQHSAIQNPAILKKLVDKLSLLNLLALNADVLGEAFEHFLHQDLVVHKQSLGIYFTPRHIVTLILDLIELKSGDQIYDPTCGAGAFLTEAFKVLKNSSTGRLQDLSRRTIVFGREISDSIHIARLNLMLVGANPNAVCQMDALQSPIQCQFSVILANFPFSQKTNHSDLYKLKGKDANPVFLKHIITALKPDGVAAVIVPDRLLFHGHSEYIQIRKLLLDTCQVLGIIQLHELVFMPYTKQPTSILIFKKGGSTTRVWFFEVREDGFKKTGSLLGRTCFPIVENDLVLLRALWKNKKDSPHSFSVSARTIANERYHLSMNRYKRVTMRCKNGVPLGQLCDIVVGETPQRTNPHFYGGKHLFVRIKDLNTPIIHRTEYTLTDEGVRHSHTKSLKKHTLLFSFKLTVAKVAFAGKTLYVNDGIAGLIPKDTQVLSQYLYYVLPALDYTPYLNRNAKGPGLNRTILETIQIPLPSLRVQKQLIRTLTCQEAKQQHHLKQVQKIIQFKHQKIQQLLEKEF